MENSPDNTKKMVFLSLVGAVLLVGGMVGGYWVGRNSVRQIENDKIGSKPQDVEPQSTRVISENNTAPTDQEWKSYLNEKYGYSISYPGNWLKLQNSGAPDTDSNISNQEVGAPPEMNSKGVWATIRINNDSDYFKKILTAKKGRVTTNQYPDWISETVFLEYGGKLYAIGNGAISDRRFEDFYQSFSFL